MISFQFYLTFGAPLPIYRVIARRSTLSPYPSHFPNRFTQQTASEVVLNEDMFGRLLRSSSDEIRSSS